MQKVVIIGGPTGTGKTAVGIYLAKKFNGEIISADSRQIYKYLEIGTNKGKVETFLNESNNEEYFIDGVKINLINLIEPSEKFDLFRYQQLAYQKINGLINLNKLPIMVGGTGLYIDSIVKNYSLEVNSESIHKENSERRNFLNSLSKEQLQRLILNKTGETHNLNYSDWNNPRRLIRFIEKFEENLANKDENHNCQSNYDFLFLYPEYKWEELKNKIDKRVIEMVNSGLIEETKNILKMGFTKEDPAFGIMGYKEILNYLDNEVSLDESITLIQQSHRQYAKRQRTWFENKNRDYNLEYFDSIKVAEGKVKKFLETK